MRWIKHLTNSHNDPVMVEMMEKFGSAGYGYWWIILETIGAQVDEKNDPSCRYPIKFWQRLVRDYHKKTLNLWLIFMQSRNKLVLIYEGEYLTITCPNILKYKDEYKAKQERKSKTKSGQTPEKVRSNIELETEKEINIPFEVFWKKYPPMPGRNRGSKSEAEKKWNRMVDKDRETAFKVLDEFIQCDQWKNGYAPMVTTWLNKKLWEDPPLLSGNGTCQKCGGSGQRDVRRFVDGVMQTVKEPCPCGKK